VRKVRKEALSSAKAAYFPSGRNSHVVAGNASPYNFFKLYITDELTDNYDGA